MRLRISACESGFDSRGRLKHHSRIESFLSITAALELARDDAVHAGATGFLRRAAQSLADAGCGDASESAGQSVDDEVRVLSDLITRKRRWLNADEISRELQNDALKGGKEHRVALLPNQNLVLKVADARKLATESLFDYLSDLLLSNHFFDDEIQLLGGTMERERLQVVITQRVACGQTSGVVRHSPKRRRVRADQAPKLPGGLPSGAGEAGFSSFFFSGLGDSAGFSGAFRTGGADGGYLPARRLFSRATSSGSSLPFPF
ncbi:MAG: hypothetical protein IAE77_15175 [Prosthecobacter sp.]|nr:hypothetical protein [Prosthecobacter sp.]